MACPCGVGYRPTPTSSSSCLCPAVSPHASSERDEVLALPFLPWACTRCRPVSCRGLCYWCLRAGGWNSQLQC